MLKKLYFENPKRKRYFPSSGGWETWNIPASTWIKFDKESDFILVNAHTLNVSISKKINTNRTGQQPLAVTVGTLPVFFAETNCDLNDGPQQGNRIRTSVLRFYPNTFGWADSSHFFYIFCVYCLFVSTRNKWVLLKWTSL